MDKIINKKALVESVAEKLNTSKKNATVAVDTVFDEIAAVLAEGGKLILQVLESSKLLNALLVWASIRLLKKKCLFLLLKLRNSKQANH